MINVNRLSAVMLNDIRRSVFMLIVLVPTNIRLGW
jgi:hypothetical protein